VLCYFVLASYAALTRAAKGGVDRLATDAEHLLRQMLMLGGLLAWGLFTVAPLLVVPLLGSKVADARILIAIMSPYLLLLSMSLFVGQLLYVYGRPSQRLKAQASKAVVTILLCLLATPRYGAVGAIVALLASELLGLLLQCAMLAPHLKTRFLLRRILQFSAAVLLGVGTGWTVAWLVDMPLAGCAVALAVFLVTAVSSRLLSREILGNLSHSH
jgi:O-antigen/teichoic acid export membrane protein